jgi:hypothetical protein
MPEALLCIDDNVPAARALGRAYALCGQVSELAPLALYGATLSGESLLLGAFQREQDALAAAERDAQPALRRRSGGITLRAGDGVLYLAVGLRERSTLMACPPGRILNRNVRGALAGLRRGGVAAHYFGRDFISIEARPGAFIGWAAQTDGRVLIELLLAETSPYLPRVEQVGYPPRAEDPLRNKPAISLHQAGAKQRGAALLECLAQGYAEMAQAAIRIHDAGECTELSPERPTTTDGLAWSMPREEAIGFVSAGVALDGAGKLRALRVAGDFFQDAGSEPALQRTLLGVEPTSTTIGHALDTVYARGGHELEGIRKLDTLREAILDAVALARART